MSVELTLVRCADVPAITSAARLGDAVSKALLHAVQTFEAGCSGKECIICSRRFHIDVAPGAFWVSDAVAIGVCEECSALSDRRLRRQIERYNI
jgi:hypothetical protein